MEDIRHEPVELTDSELDSVAGGNPHVNIGNFVWQDNYSVNLTSTGNNNNGVSGNQAFVPVFF
jgi:hypothetical protein